MARLLIDIICPACQTIKSDVFVTDAQYPLCEQCGATTARAWLPSSTPTVIQDSIEGGVDIYHGLCNADGTPHRYYSKSEIAREAKRRGLENVVEHVPSPGSDKNIHHRTTRWV